MAAPAMALSARLPALAPAAFGWLLLMLLLALIDLMLLSDGDKIEVQREIEPSLSLGAQHDVRICLRNPLPRRLRVTLHEEPPERMEHDFADTQVEVPARGRGTLQYRLTPTRRGDHSFGDMWLRVLGRMALVEKTRRVTAASSVRVYPGLREMAHYSILARHGRLQHGGYRKARTAGAGREFESLRDYQSDDDYRRIDWMATARRGRLTSREYEVERSQNVILVLDVGRTMLAEAGGIAKMDYAVNAALLLAHVATESDDRVGLLVFADSVQAWVPPRRGRMQTLAIMEALYNAEARRAESDYRQALAYLSARWKRRSLVVAFTDLWDPATARHAITEIAALQPRHLVGCVTLLDTNVLARADSDVNAPSEAYEQAVAMQVLGDRALAAAELRQRGVIVVDSPADRLSIDLVNRYLDVKARSLL